MPDKNKATRRCGFFRSERHHHFMPGHSNGQKNKGSSLPTPEAITAPNGLKYKSNPKHTPGQTGYNRGAGTEPSNSIDLFGNSVTSGKKRYALDNEGNVHQFTNTNDGSWHWSGSTGDKTVPIKKSDIPSDVKKQLGLPGKWR
jgi:filamentous hemagglutinin